MTVNPLKMYEDTKPATVEVYLKDQWGFESKSHKISVVANYTDLRIIEAKRIEEEERKRKIKETEEENKRLAAKKFGIPLSDLSPEELLLTIGLPPFPDASEMTDEELDNEVFAL